MLSLITTHSPVIILPFLNVEWPFIPSDLFLKSKSNYTYNELANLTGYHPKSLARINSMIKKGKYNVIEKENG